MGSQDIRVQICAGGEISLGDFIQVDLSSESALGDRLTDGQDGRQRRTNDGSMSGWTTIGIISNECGDCATSEHADDRDDDASESDDDNDEG